MRCHKYSLSFHLFMGIGHRPLSVLSESWQNCERSDESAISYVLSVRDKLEKMMSVIMATSNQLEQKTWYDQKAREREFKPAW